VSAQAFIDFAARPYQRPVVQWFRDGGKRAFCVWHRKAGKDRTATFIESELAFNRVGLYWHALPKYEDARKVIWDAITPDGKRLIDINFPDAICKRKNAHEMKIELLNGSIWQPVGADNFNSLVGAFPVHVTYSEFALMNPKAREYLRPAIAMNDGTELLITTPRGYNHAHDTWQHAESSKDWYTSLLTHEDTNCVSASVIEEERATMPDEMFRQEWLCDWSAANVGSILGRYVEQAEKEGRIHDSVEADDEVILSSDIGYRDTATWWFWIVRHGGFSLVNYDEDSGLDAEEWIPRLQNSGYKIKQIWLPQDAKVKTFQSRHSALEQFLKAFGDTKIKIVPPSSKTDRINAARTVMRHCEFHKTNCKAGLNGLRNWSFKFNDETKAFSKEPEHDWASHPGDGFSYGAQVMQERVAEAPKRTAKQEIEAAAKHIPTFDELVKRHEAKHSKRARV